MSEHSKEPCVEYPLRYVNALAGLKPEKVKTLVGVAGKMLWQIETLHLVAAGTDKPDDLCKAPCCICALIVEAKAAIAEVKA